MYRSVKCQIADRVNRVYYDIGERVFREGDLNALLSYGSLLSGYEPSSCLIIVFLYSALVMEV